MITALDSLTEDCCNDAAAGGRVIAVCVSSGGIPKLPTAAACLLQEGLENDGRNHAKHLKPQRAVSLFDLEILRQLVQEGFQLSPGAIGENLTVEGLHVQHMSPGTLLACDDVILKLEEPRKPCYVLDAIDPRLKEVIVGRCGYMASVVRPGTIHANTEIRVLADNAGNS